MERVREGLFLGALHLAWMVGLRESKKRIGIPFIKPQFNPMGYRFGYIKGPRVALGPLQERKSRGVYQTLISVAQSGLSHIYDPSSPAKYSFKSSNPLGFLGFMSPVSA